LPEFGSLGELSVVSSDPVRFDPPPAENTHPSASVLKLNCFVSVGMAARYQLLPIVNVKLVIVTCWPLLMEVF